MDIFSNPMTTIVAIAALVALAALGGIIKRMSKK